MSAFLKPRPFLSAAEQTRIVSALQAAEKRTSGEIRVYLESHNPMVDPADRAVELFAHLNMHRTRQRNGVLIYVAVKDRELAIWGDEGIHQVVGASFWAEEVRQMILYFREGSLADGIIHCLNHVAHALADAFPYEPGTDTNELSDDIVFGQ